MGRFYEVFGKFLERFARAIRIILHSFWEGFSKDLGRFEKGFRNVLERFEEGFRKASEGAAVRGCLGDEIWQAASNEKRHRMLLQISVSKR